MKFFAYLLVVLLIVSIVPFATAYADPPPGTPTEWGTPTPNWNTLIDMSSTEGPTSLVTVRLLNPRPEQKVLWRLMSEQWFTVKKWASAPIQISADGSLGESTLPLSPADFPPNMPSGTYFLAVQVFPYPWSDKNMIESNVVQINYVNQTVPILCPSANPGDPGGPIVIKVEGTSETDDNGIIVSNTHPGTIDYRIFAPGPGTKIYPALHHTTTYELLITMIKKLPAVDLKVSPYEGSKFGRVVVNANDFPPQLPDGKYYLSVCVPDPTRFGANVTPGMTPGMGFMLPWISLQRNYTGPPDQPAPNVKIFFPPISWTAETPGLPEMKIIQPMLLKLAIYKPIVAQSVIEVWLSKPGVSPAPRLRLLETRVLKELFANGAPILELNYSLASIKPAVESGVYSFLVRFPYMEPYWTDYPTGAFRIVYPQIPKITHDKTHTQPSRNTPKTTTTTTKDSHR